MLQWGMRVSSVVQRTWVVVGYMICEGGSLNNLVVVMWDKNKKTVCHVIFKLCFIFCCQLLVFICVNDGYSIALWTKCLLLNATIFIYCQIASFITGTIITANCNLRGLEVEFKDSKDHLNKLKVLQEFPPDENWWMRVLSVLHDSMACRKHLSGINSS